MKTTPEESPDQSRAAPKGGSKRNSTRIKKVTDIMLAMRGGAWKGPKAYARQTGMSVAQVEQLSSEAGRTLRVIDDEDGLRTKLLVIGNEALEAARGKPHEVAKLLEPMAKVAGIVQPAGAKVQVNVGVLAGQAVDALAKADVPALLVEALAEFPEAYDAQADVSELLVRFVAHAADYLCGPSGVRARFDARLKMLTSGADGTVGNGKDGGA